MDGFYRWDASYLMNDVSKIQEIADLVKKTLEGKKYSWVDSYEYKGYRPELRMNQQMQGVSVWYDEKNSNPEYGGFHVNDSYGVWGLMTTKNNPDSISFYENGIAMHITTPAGKEAYWHIYIENEQ